MGEQVGAKNQVGGGIDAQDVALIIEGGGTRNSYTAPLIKKFIEQNVRFGWVGGISAGSTLAVSYLSRDANRAKVSFTDFIADPQSGGLKSFVRGTGFFNGEYIYELSGLPDGVLPFDFETFAEHPAQLRIGSVRADTGETVYWGKEDMPDLQSMMVRIRASSTMPGLMTMPIIDGVPYVDGAVGASGGIPLDAAIADGYKRFVVVRSRPKAFRRQPMSRPRLVRRVFRKYPAVAEAMITRHERYNATIRQISELEKAGKAYVFYAEDMLVVNTERNVVKLKKNYALGESQVERDWPAIMRFVEGVQH